MILVTGTEDAHKMWIRRTHILKVMIGDLPDTKAFTLLSAPERIGVMRQQ
jgi:hypothetical protein